jgi:hypothetical protein
VAINQIFQHARNGPFAIVVWLNTSAIEQWKTARTIVENFHHLLFRQPNLPCPPIRSDYMFLEQIKYM